MDENKILEQLEKSVENIEVPESLKPDQISKKLKENQKKKKNRKIRQISGMVAGVVLVVAVGGISAKTFFMQPPYGDDKEENTTIITEKNKNAGDAYYLASDYEEVYDAFDFAEKQNFWDKLFHEGSKEEIVEDGMLEIAPPNTSTGAQNETSKSEHSTTNVQVEGIDESDIIKNDGNYLYILKDHQIHVVNIQTDEMFVEGTIQPSIEAADVIQDMYVDENKLYLVVENYSTAGIMQMGGETTTETTLLTFDITDKSDMKEVGSIKQDGSYHTSRKVNDIIYLFTSRYLGYLEEDEKEDIIPYVGEEKIPADCIYIPELGSNELIVSSVDTENPTEALDQMMVLNEGVEIYMGYDAIYLYNVVYSYEGTFTEIAKFTYKDGFMEADTSGLINGTVEDTFAISEKEGMLRVLTSDWSEEGLINQLYILDEDLELAGKIGNIAPDESIYAARYIGDMAYFITYRNMDPLFAADLSDPCNPKLLGRLEITGFSDYLHPYGEGKLLGIGYETDPQTSRTLGVKLCMFDITEATNLTTMGTIVFDGAKDTPATSDYKSVLVDAEKNLIGFLIRNYDNNSYSYKVYQWKDNAFCEVLSKELGALEAWGLGNDIRGAYAGETFYLITKSSIYSYDYTTEAWDVIDELIF